MRNFFIYPEKYKNLNHKILKNPGMFKNGFWKFFEKSKIKKVYDFF